eukprot:540215_1
MSKKYQPLNINLECIIIVATTFVCWVMNELLERKFNMRPQIYTNESLNLFSSRFEKPEQSLVIMKRLTKSIDFNGKYRMQVRGSVIFTKTAIFFLMFIIFCAVAIIDPAWYYYHFILFDESIFDAIPTKLVSGIFIGLYLWEIFTNRYAKLDWSTLLHHWMTIIGALLYVVRYASPNLTIYAFYGVAVNFPVQFMLGYKAIYSTRSEKHAKFTRAGLLVSLYIYIVTCFINVSGQIAISIYGLFMFQNYVTFCIVCICVVIWIYDDYQLIKALYSFSNLKYEMAHINTAKIIEFAQIPNLSNLKEKTPNNIITS